LHQLLHGAYEHLNGENDNFLIWKRGMLKSSPTFKFWHMIMQLQLAILTFVRAHRQNDFKLYIEILEWLAWFFTLDKTTQIMHDGFRFTLEI
jgi:hypothetical protein